MVLKKVSCPMRQRVVSLDGQVKSTSSSFVEVLTVDTAQPTSSGCQVRRACAVLTRGRDRTEPAPRTRTRQYRSGFDSPEARRYM